MSVLHKLLMTVHSNVLILTVIMEDTVVLVMLAIYLVLMIALALVMTLC